MKYLHYIYYRFYQLMVSVGNWDIAEFSSTMLMSLTFLLNIYFILGLLNFLFGMKVIPEHSDLLAIFPIFIIVAILYLLVGRKRKSDFILRKYEDEPIKNKKRGRAFIILYIILSIVLLVFSWILMGDKNGGIDWSK
ncbi:MAG: hypothetical protein ABIP30_12575 [Ferruginibacter sp.]